MATDLARTQAVELRVHAPFGIEPSIALDRATKGYRRQPEEPSRVVNSHPADGVTLFVFP